MKYFVFSLVTFLLLACGSDDTPDEPTRNYLPISQGNTWTYDWSSSIGQEQNSGTVTTEMNGTTNVDGQSFTSWMNVLPVFGFSDIMFVNKSGSQTSYRLPEVDLGFQENIVLDPFVVIDDNSTPGSILAETTFSQVLGAIPVDQDGIVGTITPTVTISPTSVHISTSETLVLNGSDTFDDVYRNEIDLEIEVVLDAALSFQGLPVDLNHVLIPQQQYSVISGWYVNEIGLARSEITVNSLEVDNTVDVPILGEVDLVDFGIDFDDIVDINEGSSVAELVDFTL